jgi:hypothetical protein
MAKFDILPDYRRKWLLWPDKQSLEDQITTRIVKIILIQILKRPQVINEEHQQDADHRNQMIARQIIKENKLQRGILGILSTGTPQIRKEDIIIQG